MTTKKSKRKSAISRRKRFLRANDTQNSKASKNEKNRSGKEENPNR